MAWLFPITPAHYLVVSFLLLAIGTVGVLTRRNAIVVLMCIELILNAANLNLVVFAHQLQQMTGQVFAVFSITLAAAEVGVGLGIVIALVRNRNTLNVDAPHEMKW